MKGAGKTERPLVEQLRARAIERAFVANVERARAVRDREIVDRALGRPRPVLPPVEAGTQ